MKGRIDRDSWSATHRSRRRAAAAALVVAVAAAHWHLTQWVTERMAVLGSQQAMPPRLAVTYVRALQLAPPPTARPVPAPAPIHPVRHATPAAIPASAPLKEPEPTEPDPPEAPQPATPEAVPDPALPEEPPQNADPALDTEPFEWPPSTRLSYSLTGNYRGEVHGNAQVEWLKSGRHYQVHVNVNLGPSFAPLFTRRMSSEGELKGSTLKPTRYDEETRKVFIRRRVTVELGPEEIVLATGRRLPRMPEVQDPASQFVHLAALFTTRPELLQVGASIELLLALPYKVDLWTYDVTDTQTLEAPFGPVDTFHLKPRRVARLGGDLTAEIWFAPQLRYLPVRILIRRDADTFIDLLISRLPDVAAQ